MKACLLTVEVEKRCTKEDHKYRMLLVTMPGESTDPKLYQEALQNKLGPRQDAFFFKAVQLEEASDLLDHFKDPWDAIQFLGFGQGQEFRFVRQFDNGTVEPTSLANCMNIAIEYGRTRLFLLTCDNTEPVASLIMPHLLDCRVLTTTGPVTLEMAVEATIRVV